MFVFLVHSENTHLIDNITLNEHKNKLVVIGQKNTDYYKICKNIKFFENIFESRKIINLAKKIILIDKIDYVDPKGIANIKFLPKGSFFGSSFNGSDELYIMQVMGNLPDILNGKWHDNYIDQCNLTQTDLYENLIEKFIFEKNYSSFDFNKYKTLSSRKILITDSVKAFKRSLKRNSTFETVINEISTVKKPFLTSKVWYLEKDTESYSERLYKSSQH